MNLSELANLAEILGAITIVTGLIFGLYQLAEFRRQRRNFIASDLMKTFYSPELSHAVTLIRTLPDAASAEELRALGPKAEEAAVQLSTIFETMGVLVYKRIAPYELVEELAGGMISVMYRKLAVWLEVVRHEQNQPSWAEWFQWLAERLVVSKITVEPAYIRFRKWQP